MSQQQQQVAAVTAGGNSSEHYDSHAMMSGDTDSNNAHRRSSGRHRVPSEKQRLHDQQYGPPESAGRSKAVMNSSTKPTEQQQAAAIVGNSSENDPHAKMNSRNGDRDNNTRRSGRHRVPSEKQRLSDQQYETEAGRSKAVKNSSTKPTDKNNVCYSPPSDNMSELGKVAAAAVEKPEKQKAAAATTTSSTKPPDKNAYLPKSDNMSELGQAAAAAVGKSRGNSGSFIDGADVAKNDVLCGRELGSAPGHYGNNRYLAIINQMCDPNFRRYNHSTRRAMAARVAARIKPGRFLRRPERHRALKSVYEGTWEELSQEKVVAKIYYYFWNFKHGKTCRSATVPAPKKDLLQDAAASNEGSDTTTTTATPPSAQNQGNEDDDDDDDRKPAAAVDYDSIEVGTSKQSGSFRSSAVGQQGKANERRFSIQKSGSSTRTEATSPEASTGKKRKVTPSSDDGTLGKAARRTEGKCSKSSSQQHLHNQPGWNIQETTAVQGDEPHNASSADAPSQESAAGGSEEIWSRLWIREMGVVSHRNTALRTQHKNLIQKVEELRSKRLKAIGKMKRLLTSTTDGQQQMVDSGANDVILMEAERIVPSINSFVTSIQRLVEQNEQLLAGIPQLEEMLQKEEEKMQLLQEWEARTKDLITELES